MKCAKFEAIGSKTMMVWKLALVIGCQRFVVGRQLQGWRCVVMHAGTVATWILSDEDMDQSWGIL